ncbi:hypothetical protein AX768_30775 (plasmid) [Burkholderia sp. PAMC 28687]|nr:hypothetical protein AX768_30775 [Burkholderia sp. PAMC 28687]
MMFYALRHAVDSFVRVSKNAPKESPATMTLRAFCRAAMPSSALRALRALITAAVTATQHQHTNLQKQCCTNDGVARSSDETLVMRVERRGGVSLLTSVANSRCEDE